MIKPKKANMVCRAEADLNQEIANDLQAAIEDIAERHRVDIARVFDRFRTAQDQAILHANFRQLDNVVRRLCIFKAPFESILALVRAAYEDQSKPLADRDGSMREVQS